MTMIIIGSDGIKNCNKYNNNDNGVRIAATLSLEIMMTIVIIKKNRKNYEKR